MAVRQTDMTEMLALATGCPDKIHHLAGRNSQGRILEIKSCLEVIIIIGDERQGRGSMNIFLCLRFREIGKDEIGCQHFKNLMLLALGITPYRATPGNVDIVSTMDEVVSGKVFAPIAGTKHIPLLVWRWNIFYRLPCSLASCLGDAVSCNTNTGRCCFLSRECHISQCTHIGPFLQSRVDSMHDTKKRGNVCCPFHGSGSSIAFEVEQTTPESTPI